MSKKKRESRTNTMRLLDANGVRYEVLTFSEDIHSATEVAQVLGIDPDGVYKTLVVERPGGKPILVMVPGTRQVDLGVLAASIGEKKLRMASHHDAERLTGLQVGGISALALLNKGFEIYIDRTATEWDRVAISAGKRGINLCLSVEDLVRVTGACWADTGD